MQLVKILNHDSKPLVLNGNERITIAPNGSKPAIIPFDVAAGWFGDPRTLNVGRNRTRSDVFRQVQQLWGYAEGVDYYDDDGNRLYWDDIKPNIEATDLDDNPIVFVMDDPDGERALDATIVDPSAQDAGALQQQIAQMNEQIAALTALIAQQAAPAAEPAATSTPEPGQESEPNTASAVSAAEPAATSTPEPGQESEPNTTSAVSATELPKAPPSTAGAAEDSPRTTKVGGRGARR